MVLCLKAWESRSSPSLSNPLFLQTCSDASFKPAFVAGFLFYPLSETFVLKFNIAMTNAAIAVDHLTYDYPGRKALDDVSFTIERGSIAALVGPNGAGKSTLLRTLAGLETPSSGRIEIADIDVGDDPRRAHTRMGYLSDDFGLYDDLTVYDVLAFIGGCHKLSGPALHDRITWVTGLLRLQTIAKQKCGTLSRGWRQRTGIAMAILHRPDVLLLDEPASGLDPEARVELAAIMRALQAEGITSMVSSHILAELEEYCTSMLVLRDGRIQEHVSLQSHRDRQNATIIVTFATPLTLTQAETFEDMAGPVAWRDPSRVARLAASNDPLRHRILLTSLVAANLPVCGFTAEDVSLQSIYLETAQRGGSAS